MGCVSSTSRNKKEIPTLIGGPTQKEPVINTIQKCMTIITDSQSESENVDEGSEELSIRVPRVPQIQYKKSLLKMSKSNQKKKKPVKIRKLFKYANFCNHRHFKWSHFGSEQEHKAWLAAQESFYMNQLVLSVVVQRSQENTQSKPQDF